MANYQLLKADIDAKVYQNGHQEITGENLNSVLNAMVTTLGAEYQFAGVATKDTNPETTDAKVFYIANGKGTYTNFGGIEVTEDDVVVLYWDTAWHKVTTGIASQAKLTELEEETVWLSDANNIIDQKKLITGYYIQDNRVYPNENYKVSDYTFVSPLTVYKTQNLYAQIQFFDAYKKYLSYTQNADSIQTPDNCYYIRVCCTANQTPIVLSLDKTDKNVEIRKQLSDISIHYSWEDGYYDSTLGIERTDSNYSRTTKFSVKPGDVLKSSDVFNFCFWDENGLFISALSTNPVTCPDNAALCAINFRNTEFPNLTRDNLIVHNLTNEFGGLVRWSDIKNPNSLKHLAEYKSSLDNEVELSATPIKKVGNQYLIDINTLLKYSLHFEFQMPSTVNTEAEAIELVKCNYLQSNRSTGGVNIDIIQSSPIAGVTQQPKYTSMLKFFPVTVKDNNYHAEFKPDGEGPLAPWTGDDVFSIRFAGDVTESSNQDIVYSLDSNGLTVKHLNGTNILNEPFPASGLIYDFAETMATKCATGGDYKGIIEFEYYGIQGNVSELIHVSNIPLVSYYNGTEQYDAFPSFVTRVDTKWHSIDILFDPSKSNFLNGLLRFYIDGTESQLIDVSLQKATETKPILQLTIGNTNVPIRNLHYKQGECKILCPKVIVCMMHPVSDDFIDYGPSSNTTQLSRLYELCEYMKSKGFDYAPLTDIVKHFTVDAPINEHVFSIIHDDYYYLAPAPEKSNLNVIKRWRDAYKSMGIKPSFAIIPYSGTYNIDKPYFEKDNEIAEFHLHDDHYYESLTYANAVSTIRNTRNLLAADYKDSDIFTWPGGDFNANLRKIFKHEGFCYCSVVGGISKGTGVTKAFDNCTMPRLTVDNRIQFSSIKEVIDALAEI